VAKSLLTKQTLLAFARRRRGWTQAYVAEQVDVSVETVRQWERGRHLPYQATVQRLCDLFQMTPEALGLLNEEAQWHLFKTDEAQTYVRNIETSEADAPQDVWEPSDGEKKAAWEIYVELVTRIPIVALDDDKGILREALSSLYSLFHLIRTILRSYNPAIAQQSQDAQMSLCYLVVRMLNTTLRPLLSKWHPLLKDYEDKRPISMGVLTYEQQWEKAVELRQEIALARKSLIDYANTFAQIAGVSSLIDDTADGDL